MSTRRRWIVTVTGLLGASAVRAVRAAQGQRGPAQPASVTLIIEGMT
jgi:hypothetical protein